MTSRVQKAARRMADNARRREPKPPPAETSSPPGRETTSTRETLGAPVRDVRAWIEAELAAADEDLLPVYGKDETERGRRNWLKAWERIAAELEEDEKRRDLGAIPEDPAVLRRRCQWRAVSEVNRRHREGTL